MVDFKKRLAKTATEKPVAPEEIYDRLDRASDKGPLRPVQRAVLEEWHRERRMERDVILKLHTGQGKTLIGLLILQSKLNEKQGRALYLCPNHFLVNQTLSQAEQFGIHAIGPEAGDLPSEFMDGKAVLVAPVQKLFNGRTKFGLGAASTDVSSLVLDDAHACIDAIKDACVITIAREHAAYPELIALFAADLEDQGVGTYAEIRRLKSSSFLPVPYWSWIDRYRDVAAILAKYADTKEILFAWPLIRDILQDCLCIVSGRELVISPYLSPLERFGSYEEATHRVFMSATVTDDSFLVRGLGLSENVIKQPLVYNAETWSGEKMVLIPSLVDGSLNDAEIVNAFAKPAKKKRRFGIVVLTPGFEFSKDWEAEGAVVAKRGDIEARVEGLRDGHRDTTLVVANRYDGIDLPDDTCRILIIDGKPRGEALLDRYVEGCRPGSEVLTTRTARIIEQGLGRAVRGEKDYCVILLTGADLVKAVRTKESLGYFSQQTRTQIELGMEVAEYAQEDVAKGKKPIGALEALILQCLNRDDGWKAFYVERMNSITESGAKPKMLDVFAAERTAELMYRNGDTDAAVDALQLLTNGDRLEGDSDRGWYLQEMARYRYPHDKSESNSLQLAAHKRNRYLLKPRTGMAVSKLAPLSQKRVAAVIRWMRGFESYEELSIAIDAILTNLHFGVRAEPFETAIDALAAALGFSSERPDKEWKEGPDNLWALRDGEYLLIECKSEVEPTRELIGKNETGQMNNASAWFERVYHGAKVTRIMIIPTKKVAPAAGFNEPVGILREKGLKRLTRNVRSCFDGFRDLDLRDLSEKKVQSLLEDHDLRTEDLVSYTEETRQS